MKRFFTHGGVKLRVLLLVLLAMAITFDGQAQRKKRGNRGKKGTPTAQTNSGGPRKGGKGPKAYKEVITDKAKSDEGVFTVHKVDDKYYYEIPDSLFGREFLMVTRIAKTAANFGYGGEKQNTQVLRWQHREEDKKVLVRVVSYNNTASDSLPVYQSVVNSNFEPILAAFDVAAYKKDTTGTILGAVVDVTSMFSKDVKALGIGSGPRRQYQVRNVDNSRSFIERVSSYPINIEARHVKTYNAGRPPSNSSVGSITVEINNSMILLPETPMVPRLFDQRVGWFTQGQTDYGIDAQKATRRQYLVRWRLEPKDPEAYARGELVEPVKPIVYYIDPATPEKWRPYLKQGVEDWQVAFEAAGFKNAIIAMDAPTAEEDPEWSPEDARYSVIRYFASNVQNAYGPNVHDPRSGEILESDIGWYHNVMNLLRNWFFIQTAAVNPEARSVKFDDEVMGGLIRFVSAHEVGHTLGLPHNMGSSPAYPVDSLRSASFTQQYGTAPSIMDYARFNYIAQPEDEGVSLYPNVGPYDKWSVKFGYTYFGLDTPEEERETLNEWVLERAGDPIYRFGRQTFNPIDPSSQTEDLGDDAMKASAYGVKNLNIILDNLIEWTAEDGKNYEDLEELYGQVVGQWNRYNGHVRNNIGGMYEIYKTYEQEGVVYTPVPKEKQKRAMAYLQEQVFATPEWMIRPEILRRVENAGMVRRIQRAQAGTLNAVLDPGRLARLIESEAMIGNEAYTMPEMMRDLRNGIWSEARSGAATDVYRRNLQRTYIEGMESLMTSEQSFNFPPQFLAFVGVTPVNVSTSDIRPMVRAELKALRSTLRGALGRTRDSMTRYHYEDAIERITMILEPK